MDAVASTAGVAAALVGTQEGKEVDNGIQHDTHKDDTKPSSAHGLVHKKRRRSRTLSNGHPTSPEGEEERRGKDKKNETEKERREGGGGDEKERSPTPARLRATSPTSSPHTTRSRQGAAVLPALSLSVLTQHQVVHKDKQPSPPQQPDNKKKKGSWRKIGSGPLKKPHHDDNIAEQEDHEMAQFEKVRVLCHTSASYLIFFNVIYLCNERSYSPILRVACHVLQAPAASQLFFTIRLVFSEILASIDNIPYILTLRWVGFSVQTRHHLGLYI
jgi:hypothetical protein